MNGNHYPIPPRNGEGDRPKGGGGVSPTPFVVDNLEEWTRFVRASREIDHGHACTTDRLDESDLHWLDADPPWTWRAIATLLAALAAGGAAVWWFAA